MDSAHVLFEITGVIKPFLTNFALIWSIIAVSCHVPFDLPHGLEGLLTQCTCVRLFLIVSIHMSLQVFW